MDPHLFEQEVRRIARYRWPSSEYSGTDMIAGRERDGIYITEECVHLVECTCLREKAKAKKDLEKLYELFKIYKRTHPDKAIKCWFITLHDPTADQAACRREIKGAPDSLFNIISFSNFQSKLIDTHEYLQVREKHKFGSIYDPKTGSTDADIKYIEVGLRCKGEDTVKNTSEIAESILDGSRYSLLGEYGVGKSMSLREIFRQLAQRYRKGHTHKFPIYLNLREHQGEQEPAEILERHARNIGFRNPSQLVRAWKAGYSVLLLDGFDEVSSLGLQGAWRRLRDARKASMAGVRRIISESPSDCGIAIAGREHFFDTDDERKKALSQGQEWKDIRLDEFNENQIAELTKQFGFQGDIPAWVPSRPLLLSTLFAKGLTADATRQLSLLDNPAEGWDFLLDEICNREARIESGISGENVRAILESLSTLCRCKESGVGPLVPDDIVGIFQSECGFSPTDEALIVLQRLPGLGRDQMAQDDSRAFVDTEFADACRAGDFIRFCTNPYDDNVNSRLQSTCTVIGPVGISLSANRLEKNAFNEGKITAAINTLTRNGSSALGATSADLVQLAIKLDLLIKHDIQISNLLIENLDLDKKRSDISHVHYTDCFFNSITIDPNITNNECPTFKQCLIQEIDGRISSVDLPNGRFIDCVIETFLSKSGTTNSTLDLDLPIGARVLLTILKKLFVQSLSGRKENALYRGLDSDHQTKVAPILTLLKAHSIILASGKCGEPIWIPIRRQRPRILSILGAPSKSTDEIIIAARKI